MQGAVNKIKMFVIGLPGHAVGYGKSGQFLGHCTTCLNAIKRAGRLIGLQVHGTQLQPSVAVAFAIVRTVVFLLFLNF